MESVDHQCHMKYDELLSDVLESALSNLDPGDFSKKPYLFLFSMYFLGANPGYTVLILLEIYHTFSPCTLCLLNKMCRSASHKSRPLLIFFV